MLNQNDFETLNEQIKLRKTDRLGKLLIESLNIEEFISKTKTDELSSTPKGLIALASSDVGVQRNGGRRGAEFGPKAILAILKTMAIPHLLKSPFLVKQVSRKTIEEKNFDEGQKFEESELKEALRYLKSNTSPPIIHLGGGHDHIFPFVKALESSFSYGKLLLINIDAHLDTRTDHWAHSGTPLRQMAETTERPLEIWQVGIHPFANPDSNRDKFQNPLAQMKIMKLERFQKDLFKELKEIPTPETLIFVSIDSDALCASIMEAVSAVNHDGLLLNEIRPIISWAMAHNSRYGHGCPLGIYEYNPLYEGLSQKGARALSTLIYPVLLGQE